MAGANVSDNPLRLLLEAVEVPRAFTKRCVMRSLLKSAGYDHRTMASIVSVYEDERTARGRNILIEMSTERQMFAIKESLIKEAEFELSLDTKRTVSVKVKFPPENPVRLISAGEAELNGRTTYKIRYKGQNLNMSMLKLVDLFNTKEENYYYLNAGKYMAFVQCLNPDAAKTIAGILKQHGLEYSEVRTIMTLKRTETDDRQEEERRTQTPDVISLSPRSDKRSYDELLETSTSNETSIEAGYHFDEDDIIILTHTDVSQVA
jgi:uncharacterized protein (UPF0335 family)